MCILQSKFEECTYFYKRLRSLFAFSYRRILQREMTHYSNCSIRERKNLKFEFEFEFKNVAQPEDYKIAYIHNIHTYIYIYMYIYIRTYIHTYIQTYIHTCMYA